MSSNYRVYFKVLKVCNLYREESCRKELNRIIVGKVKVTLIGSTLGIRILASFIAKFVPEIKEIKCLCSRLIMLIGAMMMIV